MSKSVSVSVSVSMSMLVSVFVSVVSVCLSVCVSVCKRERTCKRHNAAEYTRRSGVCVCVLLVGSFIL